MKTNKLFAWYSPLMEIISAEERVSKSTERPYMVVKARMVFFGNAPRRGGKIQTKKVYTMLCFSEPLFGLFEAGNLHTFEGELSFDWGNTWLKIVKMYGKEGNRLLRSEKKKDNEYPDSVMGRVKQILEERESDERTKEKPFEKDGLPCDKSCWECENRNCGSFVPY